MSESGSLDRRRFELLQRVLDRPADEWDAVLDASDQALAADVRDRLRAAAERGRGFLSAPDPARRASVPDSIGAYRLIEQIGEGGMGLVFRAEQQEPVRRIVALKVLRRVLSGHEALARFDAERQAMGRLDHPNIGKLLEAGTTDEGQPFFAMELIDGVPITEYCDAEALSLTERLRLFVRVCRGVEHAHKKLLLHRDIKPSNILVAEVDGDAIPKLIDFGIAKSLDSDWAVDLKTGDRLIGTPAYMSPEALELGGDVDVRSDVFSLGVVLYELLTGHRPWRDDNPTPHLDRPAASPSRLFDQLERTSQRDIAARVGETPIELGRRLRGDLDWIALAAVAVDPAERYGSVAELADDVERLLADEPVMVRAPTTTYLLRKLVRRHRGRVVVAGLLAASLVLGAVGTGIGMVRARAEAHRANQEAMAARSARDSALAASRSAELLVDFFIDLFTEDSSSTTAAEMLDRDVAALDTRLADQPRAKGILLLRLAGIQDEWGELDQASALAESAVELLAPDDANAWPEVLDAYELWIATRWKQARFTEAGQLTRRALELAPRFDEPADRARQARVASQGAIAMLYIGHWQQADAWLSHSEALIADLPAGLPERGPAMAMTQIARAGLAYDHGDLQDGIDRYRETAQRIETALGPNHRRLQVLWTFIAQGERRLGRLDEAEALLQRGLELGESYRFDDGIKLAQTLAAMALLRRDQNQFDEAEALLRRSLEARSARLPASNPAIIGDRQELAWTIWSSQTGRDQEAIELLAECQRALDELGEPVYPHRFVGPTRLGHIALAQGRLDDAESYFEQACADLDTRPQALPADHATCELNRARVLIASGRRPEARELLQRARSHGQSTVDRSLLEAIDALRVDLDG